VLAYSFDRQEIVDALLGCHRAGHHVKVGVDYGMTMYGKTRDQQACLKRLAAGGIEIVLIRGDPLGPVYRSAGRQMFGNLQGIQHCKTFYAEYMEKEQKKKVLILGSANWTLSSQCNCEMSVLNDLSGNSEASDDALEMITEYFSRGTAFDENRAAAAMRARSASPKVGRTQKKFAEAEKLKARVELSNKNLREFAGEQ